MKSKYKKKVAHTSLHEPVTKPARARSQNLERNAPVITKPSPPGGALSRSTVESSLFFIIGVMLAVLPMTWWLRGIGLLIVGSIACDLVRRFSWKRGAKVGIYLAVITAISITAWSVLPSEYRKEHGTGGEALSVVGRGLFVFTGAYHDPFGGPEQYGVSVGGVIENKTQYPTGLNKWRTLLKFKDGHSVDGMDSFVTDNDVPVPLIDSSGRQLTMRAVDYLPIKAMQPIRPGGEISGWLTSVFKGYTRSDVRGKGVILIVEFSEIATGKQHVITYPLDEMGRELPPGTFFVRKAPGVK